MSWAFFNSCSGTAQRRIADPRVRFAVGDARALPMASESYDAVVAGRVLNFIPDPSLAVAEMVRAARPDGAVSAIDLPKEFRDLDDFWLPHTMPGASAGQRYVSWLDDERKSALREQLRATLPIAADGSLHLLDRAWAVRGTK